MLHHMIILIQIIFVSCHFRWTDELFKKWPATKFYPNAPPSSRDQSDQCLAGRGWGGQTCNHPTWHHFSLAPGWLHLKPGIRWAGHIQTVWDQKSLEPGDFGETYGVACFFNEMCVTAICWCFHLGLKNTPIHTCIFDPVLKQLLDPLLLSRTSFCLSLNVPPMETIVSEKN